MEDNFMTHKKVSVISTSRKSSLRAICFSMSVIFALAAACVVPAGAHTRKGETKAAPVFVNTALGGFILGYDIDQNGNEGILAEALTLSDGSHNVALETFDQTT